MLLQQLFEAKQFDQDDVDESLEDIEKLLPYEGRFKRAFSDMETRTVYWVTQEMDKPHALRNLAKQVSTELLKKGFGLWQVKACIRNEYRGKEDTDWVVFKPIGTGA